MTWYVYSIGNDDTILGLLCEIEAACQRDAETRAARRYGRSICSVYAHYCRIGR
jgi:hypothetical protein